MRKKIAVILIVSNVWAEKILAPLKIEVFKDKVRGCITVITAEDIEKTGKHTVFEVLQDVVGLCVMQNSESQGITSVYIRGEDSGYTLVSIDGVKVNDPILQSFDFSHLTTDNIERIEIIKGPQSAPYGSGAMAGVINIITKKGKGKPKISGYFEGGSYDTFRENLNLTGSTDRLDYSFSTSFLDSSGINRVVSGTERDGYRNTIISSKIGYKPFDNTKLSLSTHFTDSKTSIDDAYKDDPNHATWLKELACKLGFKHLINSWWWHNLSFSYHNVARKYRDENDAIDTNDEFESEYKRDNRGIEWQHNFSPFNLSILTLGFEYEEEEGSSYWHFGTFFDKTERRTIYNKAFSIQNQFNLKKLFIAQGLRLDDHEIFGLKTTYKISTAYLISEKGIRLKGNWGNGFKANPLFYLYLDLKDSDLKPDESKSYDFGVEQNLPNRFFSVIYFHNDFKLGWDSKKRETEGLELETRFLPLKNLTIGANFTSIDTKDKTELLERPKTQINFKIDWQFLQKVNLNLGINYVGSRKDHISWPSSIITEEAYTIVRLASSYDITQNFQISGRIENLFDKEYHIQGYAMPRRSFFVSTKASF